MYTKCAGNGFRYTMPTILYNKAEERESGGEGERGERREKGGEREREREREGERALAAGLRVNSVWTWASQKGSLFRCLS